LAITATALPGHVDKPPKRNPILDALVKLASELEDMGKKIPLYTNGDPATAVPFLDSAMVVLNTMKNAEDLTIAGPTLDILDVLALALPLYKLSSAISTVMGLFIGKRTDFDAELQTVVSDQLHLFNEETKKLISLTITKLPSYIPGALATPFYQPIMDKLDEAVKAYHGEQSRLTDMGNDAADTMR